MEKKENFKAQQEVGPLSEELEAAIPGAEEFLEQIQEDLQDKSTGIKAMLTRFTFGWSDRVYNMLTSPSMIGFEQLVLKSSLDEVERSTAIVLRKILFKSLEKLPLPTIVRNKLLGTSTGRAVMLFIISSIANNFLLSRAALLGEKAQEASAVNNEAAAKRYMYLAKTSKVIATCFIRMFTQECGNALSLDKAFEWGLDKLNSLFKEHGEDLNKLINNVSDGDIIDITEQARVVREVNTRTFPAKKKKHQR